MPISDTRSPERTLTCYEFGTELSPSMAVIAAVAEARECEPTELAPIYNVVDADALDALGSRQPPGEQRVNISFAYEGYSIDVQYGRRSMVVVQKASSEGNRHAGT